MEKVHAFTTFQSRDGKMSKNAPVKVEILIFLFFSWKSILEDILLEGAVTSLSLYKAILNVIFAPNKIT